MNRRGFLGRLMGAAAAAVAPAALGGASDRVAEVVDAPAPPRHVRPFTYGYGPAWLRYDELDDGRWLGEDAS
jgi:hypothetical protein